MNTKNVLIGIGIVVILVLGMTFPRSGGTVYERVVGATPGSEFPGPCLTVSGVTHCYVNQGLYTATTTICTITSPNVPSKLVPGTLGVNFTTSSTTGSSIVIATSTSGTNASTTLITSGAMGANGTGAIFATSTQTSSLLDGVMGAKTRINITMQGGQGTMSPVGRCMAEFIPLTSGF